MILYFTRFMRINQGILKKIKFRKRNLIFVGKYFKKTIFHNLFFPILNNNIRKSPKMTNIISNHS